MKEMKKIGKDNEQCSLLPSSKFSTQPQDTLHPLFHPIWSRFQHDIYSYISPALSPVQPPTSLPFQKPKHKFNMALSIRELKKSITINNGIDIFTQIRKQITRIFYRVAHAFVNQCFRVGAQCEDSDSDYVQAVVDVYDRVKGRIKVLLDCLFLVVGRFITKSGIQEELYSIINKEMVNHHNYESFITSCLNQLQSLRNSYLKPQTPPISTLIPHLALLIKLKIFPYPEYLQRSKKYYSELLPKIPTNIWMFSIVYNLIQCQKMLQTIIVPTQEQLEATRKSLRMQGWRALEQESVVDVLEKEVLVQIFDDMIQYVDYLVGGEVEREVGKESEMQQQRHQRNIKKVEYIMTTTQKNQFLKHLWQLTKQLQKSHKHHHNHLHRHHKSQVSNKIQNISPYEKLLNRICQIVGDIKKFINPQKNNNLCQIYKVVYFKQHVLDIVQQCFYADPKFGNAVTTKIYDTIQEQEQVYNSKLCSIILNPNYTYPSHSIPTSPTTSTLSPQTQNSLLSPQLFKLTPSKQHFISKFQQQFSNYILTNWNSSMNLNEQQKFIKPIQMQIGHSLARNIERMITDVWRNGCLIEHRIGNVYCRVLGSYWPKFEQAKFRLADGLLEVRADFEVGFLALVENDKKKLRWIQQYGIMHMKINQVQSTFSQLQGSIITLLNRSYRPLKPNQLKQILQSIMPLQPILSDLAQNNILLYNPQSNSYQLNYQNTQIYCFTRKQKFQSKIQKKQVERDNIIILEYSIARLLKRRKSVQKTDIAKILTNEMKIQNYVKQVSVEEINTALERLVAKDIAIIEKTRGIVKYLQ